jgi:hypothetical protein
MARLVIHTEFSIQCLYFTTEDIFPKEVWLRDRQILPRSDDAACFELISKWMNKCQSQHPRCLSANRGLPPTRLLEIGWQENLPVVRLVRSEEVHFRYIALSYCWGMETRPPPQLLCSNIDRYKAGVLWSSLPKIFQDAIYVAKFLDCPHIWIDSLCIVQDLQKDKAEELEKMHDIFQNSFLTIAAADAKDSHVGLFLPRPCSKVPDVKVTWKDSNSRTFSSHLRVEVMPIVDQIGMVDDTKLALIHLQGPLSRRAWTLQERILPPRVLHYTDYQLVWECNSKTTFEGRKWSDYVEYGKLQPLALSVLNTFRPPSQKAIPAVISQAFIDREGIYHVWYDLLLIYSNRDMSYDSDKIKAISGVAVLISQRLGELLRHGIWQSDVARGLLWTVRRTTQARVRPTTLRFHLGVGQKPTGKLASTGCGFQRQISSYSQNLYSHLMQRSSTRAKYRAEYLESQDSAALGRTRVSTHKYLSTTRRNGSKTPPSRMTPHHFTTRYFASK